MEDPIILAPGALANEWKYVLWSKDAVDWLILTEYPHLWATYKSYPRWVQRADMARYAILHKYGGIYLCGNQQVCRVHAGVASMAWRSPRHLISTQASTPTST